MRKTVINILGIDVTAHNEREKSLINITYNSAVCVYNYYKDNKFETCSLERMWKNEVDTQFLAMYYLDMIKEPCTSFLEDGIAFFELGHPINGEFNHLAD